MPINILMPALSPTMETGTLAKWHVKEGDKIGSGDLIAEVETDKATMDVEAVDEGTIAKILISEASENVAVNTPIAVLLEEDEDQSVMDNYDPAAMSKIAPKGSSQQSETVKAEENSITPTKTNASNTTPPSKQPTSQSASRIFASPLARRIANSNNIDISQISGSGPKGRVVKSDVEEAIKTGSAQIGASTPAAAPVSAAIAPSKSIDPNQILALYHDREYEEVTLDKMRATIASRLTQAKQDIPHYYLTISCNLDKILKVRKEINSGLSEDQGKISVNDFIIKASALALMQNPHINAAWAGDKIIELKSADISIAVAIDGGLITPIVRDCNQKGLLQISNEVKELAKRAKDRKLAPHEYSGGSFSISNMGMFGIDNFTSIINPPQAAILAVGQGKKIPVVNSNNEIEIVTSMQVTLSCDHRVIDGAMGSLWLKSFKSIIENPLMLIM